MLRTLTVFLLGCFVGAAATLLFQGAQPVEKRVVYRERQLSSADTANAAEPRAEIRYRTVTDTVRDCHAVPRSLVDATSGYSLVSPRPLKLTPERAVLTSYNVSRGRWEQGIYSIPEDPFSYSLHVFAERQFIVNRWRVGLGGRLSYRRLEGYARLATDLDRITPTVGLRITL